MGRWKEDLMYPRSVCFALLAVVVFAPLLVAAETPANLARDATASASETERDLTPEKAIDGNLDTRWSGIPGHNSGVWYQLDWKEPVQIGEVVIRQFDTFVFELDVQVRQPGASEWKTVQHFGKEGERLPLRVVCRFEPMRVTAMRIGNVTNGPSFNEVEVYARPFAEGIGAYPASDLRGNFIGIVTDSSGAAPVEGAEVTLSGQARGGAWEAKARSNDKGLFSAPMPLGMTGQVKVQATYTWAHSEPVSFNSAVDATGFIGNLTPRGISRKPVNLSNGKWKFSVDPPEGFWTPEFDDAAWSNISVPAHWEMEGFHSEKGIGGYRTMFLLPEGSGRLKLRFEGVYSGAEVWLNGRLVATHEGGATPFEADVTDAVKERWNLLAVRVREHTVTSDQLDHMSMYADFPLAGIFRAVSIMRVPETYVGSLEVANTFDKDYRDATMTVKVGVFNESSKPFKGKLALALTGAAAGKSEPLNLPGTDVEIAPWKRADVDLSLPVSAPKTWTAEHPNLYHLTVRLDAAGKVADEVAVTTGFRQTEVRGTELLVNGKPIKLRGTCHHDAHPLMGRAVTAELQRQDLALMRGANLNAVRTSHYPPTPELLDIADEMGMYVEAEASFCWAAQTNDLRNTPRIMQLEAELLARDRNHPSVTFWSICNESEFGYGLQRGYEWVRAADPSRPTGAATSAWLEIATLHNPISLARMDKNEKLDKPLLFDESVCVYQGIFGDVAEMWVDPGIRDYYVEPYPAIFDRFAKSKTTQGSFIWCWSDDLFCVPGRSYEYGRRLTQSHFIENSYRIPGRGIVGDAPWGVVDGWRRPKPEYWIVKRLHSPVQIKEAPVALPDVGKAISVPVENRYDFTNLAELKIRWAIGTDEGDARAAVTPRSTGVIEVTPKSEIKDGQMLALTFTDSAGQLVDTYRLPLGGEPTHVPPIEPCESSGLKLVTENTLAEPATAAIGKDFRLSLDDSTGLLRAGVVKNCPMLLEAPVLHILPTNRPLRPLPDALTWKLDRFEHQEDAGVVRMKIAGQYTGFKGEYVIEITADGQMTVTSSFENTGKEFNAREIGLRFSVPREADVLEWDRKAEWNVYPVDHIGRPRGTAAAFSRLGDARPPTWPWSQDESPMGTHDFRSTKRHIFWSGIHLADGPGVLVVSDGTQHVRASMDTERTQIHVNDWYGGTNVGWQEWLSNYGSGKTIKSGERVTSKATLKLVRGFRPG